MITDKENFLIDQEIQQSIEMLMGGKKKEEKQLSKEHKKQIVKNYVSMFFSLSAINWCNGGNLGGAWQKALNQMDEFVKAKTKVLNHPMNPCLIAIHAKYKRYISEFILTSEFSKETLKISQKAKDKWKQNSSSRVNEVMGFFNSLHHSYMPKQDIRPLGKESFIIAQRKAQEMMRKIINLNQIQGQRGAA